MSLVKLDSVWGRDRYMLIIKKPVFVDSIHDLNVKNIFDLCTGTSAGVLSDGKKIIFVKQTVSCAYSIAGKLGFVSVEKACKADVMGYKIVEAMKLGRWIIRRGDLEKADRFRKKFNLKEGGLTAVRSYDLRGENVR